MTGAQKYHTAQEQEKWLVVVEGGGRRMDRVLGVTGDSVVTVTPIPRLANHSMQFYDHDERAKEQYRRLSNL